MRESQNLRDYMPNLNFRISTYSGANNDCVECAVTPESTHVQDSKVGQAGGRVVVSDTAWARFLAAVRTDGLGRRL